MDARKKPNTIKVAVNNGSNLDEIVAHIYNNAVVRIAAASTACSANLTLTDFISRCRPLAERLSRLRGHADA